MVMAITNSTYTYHTNLPEIAGLDLTLHGHVFNALDNVYVQDSTDNSKYNDGTLVINFTWLINEGVG